MSSQPERIRRGRLEQLGASLSERDWAILRFVDRHRFAATTQLRRVFFTSHATPTAAARACIRVLDRLLTVRVLTRLERSVGGNQRGSASFVWCLDVIGDRLVRVDTDAPRRRFYEPSPSFLAHTLAVTETHVRLTEAANDGAFQLARVEIETEAWRDYLGPGGIKSVLKPDLAVTSRTPEYDDHWYIEIDCGTESLPVLLRKSRAYEQYRATGRAQAEHGVFPRVLWVMPTTARRTRLTAAIAADTALTGRLFTVIELEELIPTIRGDPTLGNASAATEQANDKNHEEGGIP